MPGSTLCTASSKARTRSVAVVEQDAEPLACRPAHSCEHEVPGEGSTRHDPPARHVRHELVASWARPGVATGAVITRKSSASRLVRIDEPVALVVDRVLVARRPGARSPSAPAVGSPLGIDPDLARGLALAGDDDERLAAGELDADEEPLVVLLEDQHVVGAPPCPRAWRHTWNGRMASSGFT